MTFSTPSLVKWKRRWRSGLQWQWPSEGFHYPKSFMNGSAYITPCWFMATFTGLMNITYLFLPWASQISKLWDLLPCTVHLCTSFSILMMKTMSDLREGTSSESILWVPELDDFHSNPPLTLMRLWYRPIHITALCLSFLFFIYLSSC